MTRKKRRQLAIATVFVLLFLPLFLSVQIYKYSLQEHQGQAEVAIVLGAAVWDGQPSPVFEERIKHAIGLYERGAVRAIVLTGGPERAGETAESEAAKAYAVLHGIPPDDLFFESTSQITYENLVEARKILAREGWRAAFVVSDPLHMKRAMTMARDLGMEAYPSPTTTSRYRSLGTKLRFLARETLFYGTYLLRRPFLPADSGGASGEEVTSEN